MYELPPELSPDLEWMLQSKQATAEMLARAMAQEYGAQVYRLAQALLNDQAAAQRANEATFVEAILNTHRYSPERGVRNWIIALAIQACGKQVPRSLVVLALYYLFGWQADEITALLRINTAVVQEHLAEFRTLYQDGLILADQAVLEKDQLDRRLTEIFQQRWPDPLFTEDEINQQVSRIINKTQSRAFRRRALISFTEVSLIGFLVLAVVGLMWGVNTMTPDIKLTPRIVVETVLVTRLVKRTVVVVQQPQNPAHPISSEKSRFIPVNLVSLLLKDGSQEGGQLPRSELRSWKTMWLDAEFIDYGPPGYIGPAQVRRIQAWISPDRVLVVRGHPVTGPTAVDLVVLQEDSYLRAIPGGPQTQINQPEADLLFSFPAYAENLANLLAPMSATFPEIRPLPFELSQGDEIAGRPSVILKTPAQEGMQPSEAWIDRETLLLLRQLRYEDESARRLRSVVQVNAVAYDVEFPAGLFDPTEAWRRGFVRDYKGTPEGAVAQAVGQTSLGMRILPPYLESPENFDPAKSRLVFQFPVSYNSEAPRGLAEVFADGYYLGKVSFGNPWTMICVRSPDGRKIAYVSRPAKAPPGDGFINWFTLENPIEELHNSLGGIYITQMAFSPDGRRLAVFGQYISIGAVYVIDTETGAADRLIRLENANSLVWSPDGNHLAMIARTQDDPTQDRVMVVRIRGGRVVYEQSVDVASNDSGEWPTWFREVGFPVETGRFDACLAPR